jgi:dCTP deaminase
MALERRMIEPFHGEAGARGGRSPTGSPRTGTTCGSRDEFKIFTNINHTVVDPKDFDPRSFVDFKGGECIIPPNSFALARSVEYFKHPA